MDARIMCAQERKKESVLDAKHPGRFQVYRWWKCGPTLTTMVVIKRCSSRAGTAKSTRRDVSPDCKRSYGISAKKYMFAPGQFGRCRIIHLLQINCIISIVRIGCGLLLGGGLGLFRVFLVFVQHAERV